MNVKNNAYFVLLVSISISFSVGCESPKTTDDKSNGSNAKTNTATNNDTQRFEKINGPDDELLTKLDAKHEMVGFSIRPPKGFQLKSTPGPLGSMLYGWITELDAEYTSPLIQVSIMPTPEGEENPTIERFHDSQMASQTRPYETWEIKEQKNITLAGGNGILTRWSGTRKSPRENDKMFHLTCTTLSLKFGETFVGMRTHLFEHTEGFTIELGEAALFTLEQNE